MEDAAAGDVSRAAETTKLGQQTGRKRQWWLGLGILWLDGWRDERGGRGVARTMEKKGAGLPLYSGKDRRDEMVVLEELWPGRQGGRQKG